MTIKSFADLAETFYAPERETPAGVVGRGVSGVYAGIIRLPRARGCGGQFGLKSSKVSYKITIRRGNA
jgi:hypothetical protein